MIPRRYLRTKNYNTDSPVTNVTRVETDGLAGENTERSTYDPRVPEDVLDKEKPKGMSTKKADIA
jgi:hypothetical protein